MNTRGLSTRTKNRERRLPVFVFPEELQFVAEDETSHKQVLTLYNPYDFHVKFQVFSNAPQRYAVVESQGSIKAHCCVDIVARHKTASEGPFDVADKFRVDIYYDKKLIGRKQILCSLVRRAPSEGSDDRERTSIGSMSDFKSLSSGSIPTLGVRGQGHQQGGGPSILVIVLALLCLLVLLLPLEGESPTWPFYLHISVNQKLIAAFALGMATMAIMKY